MDKYNDKTIVLKILSRNKCCIKGVRKGPVMRKNTGFLEQLKENKNKYIRSNNYSTKIQTVSKKRSVNLQGSIGKTYTVGSNSIALKSGAAEVSNQSIIELKNRYKIHTDNSTCTINGSNKKSSGSSEVHSKYKYNNESIRDSSLVGGKKGKRSREKNTINKEKTKSLMKNEVKNYVISRVIGDGTDNKSTMSENVNQAIQQIFLNPILATMKYLLSLLTMAVGAVVLATMPIILIVLIIVGIIGGASETVLGGPLSYVTFRYSELSGLEKNIFFAKYFEDKVNMMYENIDKEAKEKKVELKFTYNNNKEESYKYSSNFDDMLLIYLVKISEYKNIDGGSYKDIASCLLVDTTDEERMIDEIFNSMCIYTIEDSASNKIETNVETTSVEETNETEGTDVSSSETVKGSVTCHVTMYSADQYISVHKLNSNESEAYNNMLEAYKAINKDYAFGSGSSVYEYIITQ